MIDQLGNVLNFSKPPKKIISLVPSISELVIDLNWPLPLIGRTKFCIHPKGKIQTVQKIGGTKNPRIKDIIATKPDLIIANKEENRIEDIQELEKLFPVYVSDIKSLEDNYELILQLGTILDKPHAAIEIVSKTKILFHQISRIVESKPKRKACYLIWKKPYMVAGGDSFINTIMEAIGLENVFTADPRYPEKTIMEMKQSKAELILLSSEPYPFGIKDVEEIQSELKTANIQLVNGEAFSWYGSRLHKLSSYLLDLAKDL